MLVTRGTETFRPDFGGTRLSRANLERANLRGAKAQFVDFREANLGRASLVGTLLQGADLSRANLQSADLSKAELKAVRLDGSNLCGARLHDARDLSQSQLQGAFGDAATTLPDGLERPGHWMNTHLDEVGSVLEWRKWLSDPDGYTPLDPIDDAQVARMSSRA